MKKLVIVVFTESCFDTRVIKHINSLKNVFFITLVSNDKIYKKNSFHEKNIHFIPINYSGKKANKNILDFLKYNFYMRYKLFRILKNIKYDYILANDLETLIPVYFSNIHKQLSIIYDSHEIWTERNGCKKTILHKCINFYEANTEKMIVHKIRKTITVSSDIGKYLQKKWKYSKDILILRNIPDNNYSKHFEVTRKLLNIPKDIKLFVYAGAINESRNIPNLIEAFKEIADKRIGLLLIGQSDIELKDFLNDSSRIYYINQVPENHLHYYLKIADIGIHPLNTNNSLNYKYALPNKIFQFMQAGLALCLFENNAIKEIIDNNKNGVYASMNTLNDIKNNITKILSFDIDDMKKQSIKAYLSTYNWETEKKSFTKFINKL